MDNRHISEELTEIATDLIATESSLKHIADSDVTIIYLESEHEMKKSRQIVHAQCEKVPDKYKWAVPCDFTITVFLPNVENFSDEQMRILLHHELLHIGIDIDGNEETYYTIPHDIEDFKEIINRYGLDWDL